MAQQQRPQGARGWGVSDELLQIAGTGLLLCYVSYVAGFHCGRDHGMSVAQKRHEEERQRRLKIIAELDAAKQDSP